MSYAYTASKCRLAVSIVILNGLRNRLDLVYRKVIIFMRRCFLTEKVLRETWLSLQFHSCAVLC